MITLNNTQNAIPINLDQLQADAQKIIQLLEYADYDLGILLTTDDEMHRYNKDFRDKDKSTDILSFPYHTELQAGERIAPEFDDDKNLGDIIIAPAHVKNDLERWGMNFDERMRVLLVHGICHLLGYDHITDEDYEVMKAVEADLLRRLGG